MLRLNARRLEKQLARLMDELWVDARGQIPGMWLANRHSHPSRWAENPLMPALEETIGRLRAKYQDDELAQAVADMAFAPGTWQPHYLNDRGHPSGHNHSMQAVLEELIHQSPPADIVARIEKRLAEIQRDPYERSRNGSPPESNAWWPTAGALSQMLLHLPATDALLDLMGRLVGGAYSEPMPDANGTPREAYRLCHRLHLDLMAARLYEHGRFDYGDLQRLADLSRSVIGQINGALLSLHDETLPLHGRATRMGEPFLRAAEAWLTRLAQERAADPSPHDVELLTRISTLRGPEWLLRAAEIHRDKVPLSKDHTTGYNPHSVKRAVEHLASRPGTTPDSEEETVALIEQLRDFPARTLRAILPHATHARGPVLAALGWEDAAPLVELIVASARRSRATATGYAASDVPNSPDPASGTLDVAAFRAAFDAAGDDLTKQVLKTFRSAKVNVDKTIYLAEALLGWNRAKVEKSFAKRTQPAVKAYGLLPLDGPDDALERYRAIREFERGATQYGPQRQASERGAAQAALSNLAQVAGYEDVTRMEWALEGALASDVAPPGRTWEVGDYTVTLQMEADSASLAIERNGKPLKSVPKSVRESDEYAGMRDAVEALRAQVRRFRQVFEDLMARAAPLARSELETLNGMPAAAELLRRLVLLADNEALGLYLPGEVAVETLDGARVPIRETAVIAHPYHLYTCGELPGWQRVMVRRRIVQPFKQAFRELYVLTPAEEETRIYSNRFAGHLVEGRRALKLFQARGWEVSQGEVPLPTRMFRAEGIEAHFEFPDALHYMGHSNLTTDRITFAPHPIPRRAWGNRDAHLIPLADVSPTIFSEVMRDADLIASVAQVEGAGALSAEGYARRGELVTALIEELGLPGVTVEGHHAIVQGKLARYRVHLGSATIHFDPGTYLCIVPDNWGRKHKKLFLPFADEGDRKISEVISKILLLLQDDRITDGSITRQIERHAARS